MPNPNSPLSVFRFCPKCGSDSFRPDSEKSLICRNCHQQLFFNMAAAVAALIFDESGRLLFTVRKHEPAAGTLDLPGGFVDEGESLEAALKREIREELNLELDSLKYLGSFPNEYLYGGILYLTLDAFFVCKASSYDSIRPSDDVEDYVFLRPEEVTHESIGLVSIRSIIDFYNSSGSR